MGESHSSLAHQVTLRCTDVKPRPSDDVALMISDEVQFEVVEPAHCGLILSRQIIKHAMAINAFVMADG